MNIIWSLIFMVTTAFFPQAEVSQMRSLYKKAAGEEKAAVKLLKLTDDIKTNDPIFMGYNGVAQMMMAKHVGNPFKKLSYFNSGKDLFSTAINNHPHSVELRFLRFSVQAETPAFLNYKQDLQEDKRILLSRVSGLKDVELRQMILAYLESSGEISASEKEDLK